MRARRTEAPRKTAITMAVMAPGPSRPAAPTRRDTLLIQWQVTDPSLSHEFMRNLIFTFYLVHVLGVCGVLIVEGERLLRHFVERSFGADVAGRLSGHGVLVV